MICIGSEDRAEYSRHIEHSFAKHEEQKEIRFIDPGSNFKSDSKKAGRIEISKNEKEEESAE